MARPFKDGKDDILDDAERGLLRYLAVIRGIRDGQSELEACRRNGVDQSAFRRCVFHTQANAAPKPRREDPVLDEILLGPAERLYIDVFNVPRIAYGGIPSDLDATMALAIDTLLNPNQKAVVHAMYYENMTLAETSDRLELTGERVRQIGKKSLYCLRTQQVKSLCAMGIERYRELVERRSRFPAQVSKEDEAVLLKLSDALDVAQSEADFGKAREAYLTAVKRIAKNTGHSLLYRPPEHITEQPVSALPLSTRMASALRDRGYATVKSVLSLSVRDVRKWDNVGRQAVKTLTDALGVYGLSLKDG